MGTNRAYNGGRCVESSFLCNGFAYLNDLQKEVEGTIEIIEKLVQRTRWLSKEDQAAVFDWIDAQEKAASDYYAFVHKRTRQAKIDIMRSIDTINV